MACHVLFGEHIDPRVDHVVYVHIDYMKQRVQIVSTHLTFLVPGKYSKVYDLIWHSTTSASFKGRVSCLSVEAL